MIRRTRTVLSALAALGLTGGAALAHTGHGAPLSFAAGLAHPFGGADHVLAMVTVGVWAGLLGGRASWAVPASFVIAMLAGFGLAVSNVALPLVEPGIQASVVVLGLLAAMALPMPAPLAAALTGAFALLHGHAHGAELAGAAALPFAAGFALATAALHAIGLGCCVALTAGLGDGNGRSFARGLGMAAAVVGVALAVG